MDRIEPLQLLSLLFFGLVWMGCPKDADTDPQPPGLCTPATLCQDGYNPNLINEWKPVGGRFNGLDVTHDCIQGICPNVIFRFLTDSTYRFDYTEVGQDSSGAFPIPYAEEGKWFAFDCECREIRLHYNNPGSYETGTIQLNPEGKAPYTLFFEGFSTGLYLSRSSRDSTLLFFLNRL